MVADTPSRSALLSAHVFEKYADFPKAQHAVSWRAKVAYYSKKSDGCGYVKPVSTFVCTRVREIRRFRCRGTSSKQLRLPMLNKCVFVVRTRVRGIRRICQARVAYGRGNLHTCSRNTSVLFKHAGLERQYFAHVFEKGAKFAAEEEAARKVAQMTSAVPKNSQRIFTTLSCFSANEGYVGTRLGRRLLNPPEA